ncbi:MAG: uracil-DNA glycosylase [Spirochaetes bacterium]|nr:uracil-DNA glycosylase [Spirochaetota bacterium]
MEKNNIADQLYKIINLYSDFKEDNLIHEHEKINFNFSKETENKKIIITEQPEKIIDNQDMEKIKAGKRKLIDTAEKIIKCTDCNLYKTSKKVPGIGKIFSGIFVITNPATVEEENFGFPLVSESGDFFKKWMNAININPNDIFITNLLKCAPKNIKITREIIETCWKYIDAQLEIVKPKIILTLGQLALSSIKKSFYDLKKHHGELFLYKNIKVIPSFHPSDVLKDKNLKKLVWDDLKKLSISLRESNFNE